MLGNTLVGRYQITNYLGGGGFGETYVANDTQLPGSPQCVVKKLKPQSTDITTLEIARRLFDTEAQVLYKLGNHDRIPQLLAYFEENAEFYLVQELIIGNDLSQELKSGVIFTQNQVMSLLQEILEILDFVHQQKVIHRDVNPRNILRREQDNKLILIDFGAVKQITTKLVNSPDITKSTVAIGTPGYTPGEQAQGTPKFSSDIYALGIIAIQALTGLSPDQLEKDVETNEIIWQNFATVSPEFAQFLNQMICYDFRQRYASATIALQALQELNKNTSGTIIISPATLPNQVKNPQKTKGIFWKLLLGIFGLGISSFGAIFMLNRLNNKNAIELYNQGNTLIQLQRYQEALATYEKAVDIKPDYPQALYGQGKALFQLKKYQESLIAYDQAIQIQPNYLEAWTNRGFVLVRLKRYSEAIATVDKALQLKNDDPQIWQLKGDIFIKISQYNDAIKAYEQAINFQADNPELWYKKGLAFQNLKQYEEAITAYKKTVELKPDHESAWYNLGNCLVNLNRYEFALQAYDQAVQYNQNNSAAWLSRSNILMTLRRYPEAIDSFTQVIKTNPQQYQAWYNRGWALHQVKRYGEAIESYKKAISLKSNDYLVWYNLGNTQYNLQKYQEAIASYNKATRYKPNHYESWYSKGNAWLNLQQYQQAIASYDKAIEYKPDYQQAIEARKKAQNTPKFPINF
ncbi:MULTISPECIES: serine/threonine-protein kinase [Dolichospermum]|uniref:Tetratricopeptide repeat protein n=1 Tax=Dolichospermum flos-aquae CCAP 1403/13F TaxID=315271 RepID=A0A6H2BWK9_DOLFA|nr:MULTISPECIES: serine/threonine-protein kinase [Dolichospermum]MTJ21125.1 tetratricopeptide repeat protein [Dolichospermum sp. UHCC 0352]QJB43420.1 tetratricopeptide repeat protein [Dolichospermum flos-aquae CCAP 1403/13F]